MKFSIGNGFGNVDTTWVQAGYRCIGSIILTNGGLYTILQSYFSHSTINYYSLLHAHYLVLAFFRFQNLQQLSILS